MQKRIFYFLTLIAVNVVAAPPADLRQQHLPPQSAIASASPLATEAGFRILNQGGNAFDAAVAVAAVLAVVEPANSGLGGGGFWLLHVETDQSSKAMGDTQGGESILPLEHKRELGSRAVYDQSQQDIMVDGREAAPLKAKQDMYLDQQGKILHDIAREGALAAAIPGEPASLVYVAKHYGRLPLAKSLAPAIDIAQQGFIVSQPYWHYATVAFDALQSSPAARAIFLKKGAVPAVGDRIVQQDLAAVLQKIARQGKVGFYGGSVAKQLVNGVDKAGGIWQLKDLSNYRVKIREPLVGYYRGMKITTVNLPSAGGVGLLTMLNILSNYDLNRYKGAVRAHLLAETMRLAFWDRFQFLGDGDYIAVPVEKLLSQQHAKELAATISATRATPSQSLKLNKRGNIEITGVGHTTHFSILDKQGNRVAVTISLNGRFGSGFVAPGTGVVLNNHMADFSLKAGAQDIFGLVGNDANKIAAGKRPLSSMAPTFLETTNRIAIIGTPGGSRIPTMLLLTTLDFFGDNKDPQRWVAKPRFHHQYLPDVIQYENHAFSENTRKILRDMGYILEKRHNPYGNMQLVVWDRAHNKVLAASDPRGEGEAMVQ